jgi:hypothetical protein
METDTRRLRTICLSRQSADVFEFMNSAAAGGMVRRRGVASRLKFILSPFLSPRQHSLRPDNNKALGPHSGRPLHQLKTSTNTHSSELTVLVQPTTSSNTAAVCGIVTYGRLP